MKEAIAALESQLKIMTNKPSIGMSQALKIVGKNEAFELHPVLISSLEKLYNWSSDTPGTRHGNKASLESEYDIDDAKLIIVTCCSFVSYLIAKAKKNDIPLQEK